MGIIDHHSTDEPVGLGQVRRRIANWQNYRLPSGLWAASDPDVEPHDSPPPDWTGGYDFTHACLRNPLQAFVGDSTDPANTALIGLRLAHRPDCWVNFKAIGVNAVNMIVDRPNRRVGWPMLWAQTDLGYDLGRGRVNKIIRLRAAGHPVQFRFAIRLPAGFTHEIVNNGLVLKDPAGVPFMHSPPAWGQDADEKPIAVQLLAGAPITFNGVTYPTIRLVPSAADLATAVYPVRLDPTTTISGTAAIEDAQILTVQTSYNYGGRSTWVIGCSASGVVYHSVFRVLAAGLPGGTITAARMYFYRASYGVSTQPGTLQAFAVTDANTWVEGTVVGSLQTGSCCWGYAKYNTQAWAGSVGCSTIGTDYDNESPAELAYAAYTSGVDVLMEFTLKASWFSAWKAGSRVVNGFVVKDKNETVGSDVLARSTEDASYGPYFEIDTEAVGGAQLFASTYRRRRV